MIQFMKAMRDEKGEMVRNAHILGFFRRILKLLFLRTKPVFVFDGGTPALKRRTVIARRRQRENAQTKIRKTAEKLLLNHLKAMRLKDLAADLEKQRQQNDVKGKRPMIQETNHDHNSEKGNDIVGVSFNQEELDAMLAASLAAEENEGFGVDASASGSGVRDDKVLEDEDEDEEDDEEMIIPEMQGKIDPAILASLPPSMQLDLLVQMRERLMAENRQKYQKVKKAPASFSELQIQSYLKTVAFRREIDGAQKAAAGRGIGGMQTSRIASEANREFIFSSSFTGDKQALTSAGQERVEANQSRVPPVNSSTNTDRSALTKKPDAGMGPTVPETEKEFHGDVETYVDERGRLRVSRMRALGIRMTRDLQRNLDLMKEIDQDKAEDTNQEKNDEITPAGNQENTDKNNDEIDIIEEPPVVNGASIEISFEDTREHDEYDNDDDNLFARLVSGEPVVDFPVDNSASDCEWEEGVVEDKNKGVVLVSDDEEIEWEEEGFQDIQSEPTSSFPSESQNIFITKGALLEEADFQEAIRRSLEENRGGSIFMNEPCEDQTPEIARESVNEILEAKSAGFIEVGPDKSNLDSNLLYQEAGGSGDLAGKAKESGKEQIDTCAEKPGNISADDDSIMGLNCEKEFSKVKVCGNFSTEKDHEIMEDHLEEEVAFLGKEPEELESEQPRIESNSSDFIEVGPDKSNLVSNLVNQEEAGGSGALSGEEVLVASDTLVDSGSTDAQHMFQAELDDHSCKNEKPGNILADDSITGLNGAKEFSKEKVYGSFSMEKEESTRNNPSFMDVNKEHEIMEEHLEEEMVFLDKEREELGSEQRRNERNAESVSGEMFAECQELLQMFGLPYIIAPMEAEAQCAFMELSNLVDGVVTDDSDAFLFGARSVYKNIFDDRKYVETYLMKDIEIELGLDRDKLIHMALLLGSDYTEGVSGIGIVNAIEVVNAFPEKEGLREFREWIESPDPSILGKLHVEGGDNNSKRKTSKNSETITDDDKKIKQIFMNKHRNVSKNWHIPSTFPSDAVISAYVSPQVDKSTEPFAWGKPDLYVLRKLCWEKFTWANSKADELLLPVLKEYNKHETQLRMEAFYTFSERFAKIRSKRIKKAVKGIAGNNNNNNNTNNKSSELMDKTKPQQSGRGKKRKKENTSEKNLEESTSVRGRQRGRGRGKPSGRKKNSSPETSCGDGVSTESEKEMQIDELEESREVRRSGRVRKNVNYTVSDEFDNCDKENENCPEEECATTNQAVDGVNEIDAIKLDESRDIGMDKISTTQIGDGQIYDDAIDHSELSKDDYLQFGGGFCMDEDENASKSSNPEKSDFMVEENRESDPSIITQGTSNGKSDQYLVDDNENDSALKSLRAMPNLRRKKRKT